MTAPKVLLFLAVCLIWGATWIALKLCLAVQPPVLLAGTRFPVAGLVLLASLAASGRTLRVARADWPRLAAATCLLIVACYPLLYWGTAFVPSGLSAVLNLAVMPPALLCIGVLLREDRLSRWRIAGIGLGVAGLAILFRPGVAPAHLLGSAAIVGSSLVYALGSVLSRRLLRRYSPLLLAAYTMTGGGLVLLAASLLLEPHARGALFHWTAASLGGWLFLVLLGSLVAYTAFLDLVRSWGPSRAGAYAFVSPIVAVTLGAVIFHERLSVQAACGIAVLLAGAALTLRPVAARPEGLP